MTIVAEETPEEYLSDFDGTDESEDSNDSTLTQTSADPLGETSAAQAEQISHPSKLSLDSGSLTTHPAASPPPTKPSSPPLRIRFPGELTSAIPWHSLTGKLPDSDSSPPSPSTLQCPLPFTSSFRLFSLPAEIRNRVYALALPTIKPAVPNRRQRAKKPSPNSSQTLRRLSLFLISKRLHAEASHLFYTSLTFRIFPLQDDHQLPTLLNISPHYRQHLTSLELILGSDWQKPPASWRVTPALGLSDLKALRTLKVFVSFDPSHPIFKNYRVSYSFYTDFCGDLLAKILDGVPRNLESVRFDANPGVQLGGPLMSRLLEEVVKRDLNVRWGPDRGWGERHGLMGRDGLGRDLLIANISKEDDGYSEDL